MKFYLTPKFVEDYRDLEKKDQLAVTNAKDTLRQALEGHVEYYKMHRIKRMEGHPNIWEGHVKIDLCFTFHYDETDSGERIVFFRRVGKHKIYKNP